MLNALFIWKQLILFEHIRALVPHQFLTLTVMFADYAPGRPQPRKTLMFNATSLL